MTIEEMLQKHENMLIAIKRRLYVLKAFQKNFDELTKKKPFFLYNDIIYRMFEDTWHMLVIDLASLATDMLGRGGFFKILQGNTNLLSVAKATDYDVPSGMIILDGEDVQTEDGEPTAPAPTEAERSQIESELSQGLIQEMMKYNQKAFFRLFPDAQQRPGHKLKAEDVVKLKSRFDGIVRDIINDRNKHRAHRYERKEIDPSIKKLDFPVIEEKIDQIESILSDIRLISNKSSFSFNNMNMANVDPTTKDLVTMILLGGFVQIELRSGMSDAFSRDENVHQHGKKFGWQYRESMFEEMHERHEQFHARRCYDLAQKANEKPTMEIKVDTPAFNNSILEGFEFDQLDGKHVSKKR